MGLVGLSRLVEIHVVFQCPRAVLSSEMIPAGPPRVYLASLVVVDCTISKLDMTTQQEKKSQKSRPMSQSSTRSYSQEFHENTKLTAII